MIRVIYTFVYYLALPLFLLKLGHGRERLGYYGKNKQAADSSSLVFHAASLGELHAALPLIKACQQLYPERNIVLTTTTVTGAKRAEALFGNTLQHCYLPFDLPGAVKRFLRFFKPELIVIMETELWPNLLHHARQQACKVMLVNARLSDKSFRSYQKFAGFSRQMLSCIDLIAAQFSDDADRFKALGLPEASVVLVGTMKFDMQLNEEQIQTARALKQSWERPVLVAGSTRKGEEEKVLSAFREMLKTDPELLLVLVPRHQERFAEVADLLESQGFHYARHSAGKPLASKAQVLLGDSLGELQFYYSLGDIAFVGGSLVDTGCQNIIEPAALGLPVITGPSLFNFQAVSRLLLEAGAMTVVQDAQELAARVTALLQDEQARKLMADQAMALVKQQRGASTKLLSLIQQHLKESH